MWWQRILERRRRKRDTAEPEIAFWRLQSMFNNFRRILELNNAILESVADMDRALGGEYIFDRTYLEQSVRRVASNVHHVVYSLNALTGNAHVPLYDRYQDIRIILDDILSGDMRALAGGPVLPLRDVGWELEPLVGMEAVCMAELLNHTGSAGMKVANGFVLTVEGVEQLLGSSPPPYHDKIAASGRGVSGSAFSGNGSGISDLRSTHSVTAHHESASSAGSAAFIGEELVAGIETLIRDRPEQGLRLVVTRLEPFSKLSEEESEVQGSVTLAVLRLEPTFQNGLKVIQEQPEVSSLLPFVPDFTAASQSSEAYAGLVEYVLQHIHRELSTKARSGNDTVPFRLTALLTRADASGVHGVVTSRTVCEALPLRSSGAMPAHCHETLEINAIQADSGSAADTPLSMVDRYVLQRTYPYALMTSEIGVKPAGFRFPDGRQATSVVESGNRRGSSLLRVHQIRTLAETAMAMERMLGMPVILRWELDAQGGCRVVRVTPAPSNTQDIDGVEYENALSDALAEELASAEELSRGGHMVQSGVVAGTVVHVSDSMSLSDFPAGSIAVARTASPRLTPVLQRASAVICENGTIAGHLATVARELRLPAVFGVSSVFERLPEGSEVTVDAGETVIYRGVLPALLQFSTTGADLYPTAPEYHTLRRLLRFIAPLHLVNPDAPEFSPAGCRTFHDLIHYCHEKAVDELAHFQERRPGLGSIRTRRMHIERPMDLRVLDISGGLMENASTSPSHSEVVSAPFSAFLKGLLRDEAWDTAPVSLGLRDVINSMPLSMSLLNANANTLGENLAIISRDYVNISLRLGYHFSVVDAYLGPDRNRNHIYFRFVGGLADPERRHRRAVFLRNILEDMGFKVVLKGDLVLGSLKQEEPEVMRCALVVLGALTAYSRQRDTALYSDEAMYALYDAFARVFLSNFEHISVNAPVSAAVSLSEMNTPKAEKDL